MRALCTDSHVFHWDNVLFIGNIDPVTQQRLLELETKSRYGKKNDPERPPKPEHGDKYIVIGAIVGLIIGGILGAVIGNYYFGFLGGAIGGVAGIIAGGIVGAEVGSVVKKRRGKREIDAQKPF